MTVIAYRDGVMAADTASFQSDFVVSTNGKKIRRHGEILVGCAGFVGDIEAFHTWVARGLPEKKRPTGFKDFAAIVVRPDGVALKCDESLSLYPASGQWCVCGAHIDFMIGAFAMGATAEQAVRLAIAYGIYAGGGVQVERVST